MFIREYIIFAVIAGIAWGIGGYFEKAGLYRKKRGQALFICLFVYQVLLSYP